MSRITERQIEYTITLVDGEDLYFDTYEEAYEHLCTIENTKQCVS